MLILQPTGLYFLGDSLERQKQDLCLHGHILFRIGKDTLGYGDYCVSAAAMRFLRTLTENHYVSESDQLLPCCGHNMFASPDKMSVDIGSCPDGDDFDILHENGGITVICHDWGTYHLDYAEYCDTVLGFCAAVEQFYRDNPRDLADTDAAEHDAFEAYWNEWNRRMAAAKAANQERR
ncbi:MAG: hypothetical protein IJX53_07850 [Clostridia bacterium]|nr:hypothetical protein [Clostridia bacterium]